MNTQNKNLSKTLGTLCILGVLCSYVVIGIGLRSQKDNLIKAGTSGVFGSLSLGLAAMIASSKERD